MFMKLLKVLFAVQTFNQVGINFTKPPITVPQMIPGLNPNTQDHYPTTPPFEVEKRLTFVPPIMRKLDPNTEPHYSAIQLVEADKQNNVESVFQTDDEWSINSRANRLEGGIRLCTDLSGTLHYQYLSDLGTTVCINDIAKIKKEAALDNQLNKDPVEAFRDCVRARSGLDFIDLGIAFLDPKKTVEKLEKCQKGLEALISIANKHQECRIEVQEIVDQNFGGFFLWDSDRKAIIQKCKQVDLNKLVQNCVLNGQTFEYSAFLENVTHNQAKVHYNAKYKQHLTLCELHQYRPSCEAREKYHAKLKALQNGRKSGNS